MKKLIFFSFVQSRELVFIKIVLRLPLQPATKLNVLNAVLRPGCSFNKKEEKYSLLLFPVWNTKSIYNIQNGDVKLLRYEKSI